MDINLIKNKDNLYKVITVGDNIVEYSRDTEKRNVIHITLYNPATNRKYEITPEREKYDLVKTIIGVSDCKDVFYTSVESSENDRLRISLYRYSVEQKTESRLCYFNESSDVLSGIRRIKAFILSENAVLLQTETLQRTVKEDMMGNIAFRLALLNLETGEVTSVNDPNFINNGINSIIPLANNKIMIKTGYSYLGDRRLDEENENEALIESIYITTVARFVADVALANESVDMDLIESTYFDKHITKPRVTGSYIHFCIVDSKQRTTKCVFYNYENNERLEYSINSINLKDLNITYVVNNIPYVRKNAEGVVNFVNLRKAVSDVFFYDEEFVKLYDDIFILESKDRKRHLHIYSYPGLQQVCDEKRPYYASCCLNGNYYIYC